LFYVDRWTDKLTDTMTLTAAFCNFPNIPKKGKLVHIGNGMLKYNKIGNSFSALLFTSLFLILPSLFPPLLSLFTPLINSHIFRTLFLSTLTSSHVPPGWPQLCHGSGRPHTHKILPHMACSSTLMMKAKGSYQMSGHF